MPPHLLDDLIGVVACREDRRRVDQRRKEDRQRLTEHVTERQQAEESNRPERPEIAANASASRSTGVMFATMLRWVMTTPFGSPVVPDVKTISATVFASRRARPGSDTDPAVRESTQRMLRMRHIFDGCRYFWHPQAVSEQEAARLSDCRDAGDELRRRCRIDRNHDDARQHTSPERCDPFGSAVTPDQEAVAGMQARVGQLARPCFGCRTQLVVRVRPLPEPIVVDEGLRGAVDVAIEEVEQMLHGSRLSLPDRSPPSPSPAQRSHAWVTDRSQPGTLPTVQVGIMLAIGF